jgi:hypothetical protein
MVSKIPGSAQSQGLPVATALRQTAVRPDAAVHVALDQNERNLYCSGFCVSKMAATFKAWYGIDRRGNSRALLG